MLIDSCVLIDLLDQDPTWRHWAASRLEAAFGTGLVNPVILAEINGRARTSATIDQLLETYAFACRPLGCDCASAAGAAFRRYRERGGRAGAMLADFLIGAHATVLGVPLLTRDRDRFARYFPELSLITPEIDPP